MIRAAFIALLMLVLVGPASSRSRWGGGLPVSCQTVNYFQSRYSLKELRAMARKAGVKVTPRQLAEARQCKHEG